MPQEFELYNEEPSPSQESYLGTALRNVARGGSRLVETAVGLPGTLTQIPGALGRYTRDIIGKKPAQKDTDIFEQTPIPTMQSIHDNISKAVEGIVGKKGYLEPQSHGEKTFDKFVNFVPGIIMAGTSWPSAALGSLLSVEGDELAESLGFGPVGQFAGSLLGGWLGNVVAKGRGLSKVEKLAERSREKNYDIAKNIAPKIRTDASDLSNKIEQHIQEASRTLPVKLNRPVISNLIDTNKHLHGNSSIQNVWDAKKKLNALIYDRELTNNAVRNIYTRARNDIRDHVTGPIAQQFPQFAEPFLKAESLDTGLRASKSLQTMLHKIPGIGNFVKVADPYTNFLAFGSGWYYKGLPGASQAYLTKKAITDSFKAYQFIKNPDIRSLTQEVAQAALTNQPEQVLPALRKLDELVKKTKGPQGDEFELIK